MFDFPGDFEKHFLSAWQEPFTGFELKWIEVEICRQAMVPTNVTDLFERMKEHYPDLNDMHQSKFYRIVSSLTKEGYLKDKQEGRAKIIHTLPAGAKELGRISRYFFEIQMERFKSQLWKDLITKITKETGCLLDQKVVVIGPEYSTINTLIQECMSCPPRNNSATGELREYQSKFIFLDYNANHSGKTEASTILELEEISDWIFKADSIDVVVMFNPLSGFPDMATDILNEAKRVITEQGKIVLFEMTQQDSNIITTLMREATLLLNYSNPGSAWEIPQIMPTRTEISNWIEETDLIVKQEFKDVISSIYTLAKNP